VHFEKLIEPELAPHLGRHDLPVGREIGTDADVTMPLYGSGSVPSSRRTDSAGT
jgi:hypothetical protein